MPSAPAPVLLYNDECGVCRHIAAWVIARAKDTSVLAVRPIGDDPQALSLIAPAEPA